MRPALRIRTVAALSLGAIAAAGVLAPAAGAQSGAAGLAGTSCEEALLERERAAEAVERRAKSLKRAKRRLARARDALGDARADGDEEAIEEAKRKLKAAKRARKRAKGALADARDALADAIAAEEAACGPSGDGLYVALGDSATAGYVPGVFSHLQQTLGVAEYSDRSVPGETSGSLRGDQLSAALGDIDAASDTKAVTINIGGNDVLSGCDFTGPACAFRASFDATLTDLQEALAGDPGEELLATMAYYNPGNGTSSEASYDDRLLGDDLALACFPADPTDLGLNDVIAEVADAHGALLANPYPAFKAAGQSYMADSLHPNAAGYAAIVESFEAAGPACPGP